MAFVDKAINLILPPRCIVTGQEVDTQGTVSPEAWGKLQFISQPYCVRCGLPFAFEIEPDTVCGGCLANSPSFEKARAALKYDDVSRNIILGFKHGDQTYAVQSFLPWLKIAGQEILEAVDYLIPVPLHRWRLLRRRFNQAGLIAQALAKETRIPCLPDALIRRRATPSQGHLKAKERKRNVRGAFQINFKQRKKLVGKAVVLIDDVYTTGATVMECAKVLKKAGAKEVSVLTLARVVRPGSAD